MITNQAYRCPEFTDQYDRKLGYNSQTILCVPVRIEQSVCGVIELLNKVGGGDYLDSERDLLEIFAGYISLTIQNAVDAKKIEKMVRMDDLTGLANDRCLHERLPQEVERPWRRASRCRSSSSTSTTSRRSTTPTATWPEATPWPSSGTCWPR